MSDELRKRAKRRASLLRRLRRRRAGNAIWSPGQRRLLVVLASLVVTAATLCGSAKLLDYYLLKSGRFLIDEIEVEAGDTITRELICEYLRLEPGMPLFEIDIGRRQQEFLRDAATIRSLQIRRYPPNKISVQVIEREPLARLARRPFAVDSTGTVFVRYAGLESLPSISAYNSTLLIPGATVDRMTQLALELFAILRHHDFPLQVVDVDVSHEDYLACTMSDQRSVKLAWNYFGERSARAERCLLAQLEGLADSMNREQGVRYSLWDATIQGRVYAR